MSGTIDPASHLGARAARRVQRDLDYVANNCGTAAYLKAC